MFSPFDDNEKTVLIPLEVSEKINSSIVTSGAVETSHHENKVDIESKNFHINLVKKGVEAINNQQFRKVVLSRKETVEL